MKVFLDNNLPPRVARALNSLYESDGHKVVHLREMFDGATPDVEWIRELSEEGGWIVITQDWDIVRRDAEKQVWKSANLIAFLMGKAWNAYSPPEHAWRLIRQWDSIEKLVNIAAPGSVFVLPARATGRIGTA